MLAEAIEPFVQYREPGSIDLDRTRGVITFGRIVLVQARFQLPDTVDGQAVAPGISHYGAGKAAVEQLTRRWARELAPHGIRVNAVAPGPTESEALDRMGLSGTEIEQLKAQETAGIPLGTRGRPEDIAPWVAALARPDSWVTGQVIGIDGGYSVA